MSDSFGFTYMIGVYQTFLFGQHQHLRI